MVKDYAAIAYYIWLYESWVFPESNSMSYNKRQKASVMRASKSLQGAKYVQD